MKASPGSPLSDRQAVDHAGGDHAIVTVASDDRGWLLIEVVKINELVIGDVHGDARALAGLLRAVGVVDGRGRRVRGWRVIQVGDLLDRRADPQANLECARIARHGIDIVLAGNHEARLLAGDGARHGDALALLAECGWPRGAAACGGWLVTHAGVHPDLARRLPARAGACAEVINDRWDRRSPTGAGDALFDSVGPARGGAAAYGGVLWLHSSEWPRGGRTPWGQLIGHVPQRKPRLLDGRRWAIDLGARGGRLAGLVRSKGHGPWRPVIVAAGKADRPTRGRDRLKLAA